MRRAIAIVGIVALGLGFLVGHLAARRNVIVYAVPVPNGKVRNAVHLDWPTYGLPMTEYRACLLCLDIGNTNKLRERLDTFVDMALFDASFRRPLLPKEKREELDRAIAAVARYRMDHPSTTIRKPDSSANLTPEIHPHWKRLVNTASNLLQEVGIGNEDTQHQPGG